MKKCVTICMLFLLTACGNGNSQGSLQDQSNEEESLVVAEEDYVCDPRFSSKHVAMCFIDNQMYQEASETLSSGDIEDDEFVDAIQSYIKFFAEDATTLEALDTLREEYSAIHSKIIKLFENNKIGLDRMSTLTKNLNAQIENQTNRAIAADSKAKGYVEAYIGMTAEELRNSKSWGEPDYINKTTTEYGVSEQWVYYGRYVYLEDGIVTSIQE